MDWIELSVQAHPEAVDAIAEVFRRFGTGGVAIEQPVQVDDEGVREAAFLGLPLIKAYLPATPDERETERQIEEALWHLQAFDLSPVGPLIRRPIAEEDWAEGWKEHFHPLKIGRVVIKPTWRHWKAASDEIVVELDPGMAFGTGLHPTTRMTLEALQERVKPGMRVLDLGIGSGILAIPAGKLGASVTGLDTSGVAVDVARRNVEDNGLSSRISIGHGSIDAVRGQTFDIVLANIVAGVLIELAPDLAGALEADGELLASGIIEQRADDVRDAFQTAGLQLKSEKRDEDWWLFVAGPMQ